MILTNCAACAAPLAHNAPRCVRCHTRYCDETCQHDHWRRGHKQMCKKIHRGGNAEQYYADKKYKEAVAAAVEKCAEDTKGQKCYICLEAVHARTGEGLVRGCACGDRDGVSSPELGVAHVSCLARQAKVLVEEAHEENPRGDGDAFDSAWARWSTCSLCEQRYHGVVRCALGWACWKTYVSRSEDDGLRYMAMTMLSHGMGEAHLDDERLGVLKAKLASENRLGMPEEFILATTSQISECHVGLGRTEEALEVRREIYARSLVLSPALPASTIFRRALVLGESLNNTGRRAEAKRFLGEQLPEARRVLGEGNTMYLCLRRDYAFSLYRDDGVRHYLDDGPPLADVSEAVSILEEVSSTVRRIFGLAHPFDVGVQRHLTEARSKLASFDASARETPRETTGSFQRASEEKLRTRRIVSVADRFRRSAAETPGGDGSRSTSTVDAQRPPPSEPATTAVVSASASSLAGTVSRFELAVPAATTIQRGIRKHLGKATTAAAPDPAPSLADAVSQFGKAVSDGKYRRA